MDLKQGIIITAVFDALVGLAFIAANWFIWDYFNGKTSINQWGPLQMATMLTTDNGSVLGTYIPLPNYAFILFWVALAGNMIILVLALRGETKK